MSNRLVLLLARWSTSAALSSRQAVRVAVVSTTSRSDSRSPSISALGEVGDQIVGRTGTALRHLGGEEVAQLPEGGDVLRRAG
jgi:hypothetical protein